MIRKMTMAMWLAASCVLAAPVMAEEAAPAAVEASVRADPIWSEGR